MDKELKKVDEILFGEENIVTSSPLGLSGEKLDEYLAETNANKKEFLEEQKRTDKRVSGVLKNVHDHFGLQVTQLGSREWPTIQRIPSGSLSLDVILGGGWPRGRFVEIFGPPSGGKTILSLTSIASAQRLGGKAAFIDVEASFSPEWAQKIGVDVDRLYFAQPDFGEQALDGICMMVDSNEFDVIVLDSVAGLIPKEEMEADLVDQKMALQARMMGRTLRKLTPLLAKSKTVCLFINQTRSTMNAYGPSEITPGGQALKFYASVRVQVKREKDSVIYDDDKNPRGHSMSVQTVKNKTFPPYRTSTIPILYESGVQKLPDFIAAAKSSHVIDWNGGVKYFGTAVDELKDKRWAKWEEFNSWVMDVANAGIVIKLIEEIRSGSKPTATVS